MPREKNTVVMTVIDVGKRASIEAAVAQMLGIADGLQNIGKDIIAPTILNLRARVLFPMLQKLREYPGAPRHPLRWKSEKQRKYVMMLLRERGEEGGYKRTFKLRKGWQYSIDVDTKTGDVKLRVWNEAESYDPIKKKPVRYMPFVQGNIGLGESDRSAQRYAAPIQPFHRDTGWNPAAPIIQTAFREAEAEIGRIYEVRLTQLAKKIA